MLASVLINPEYLPREKVTLTLKTVDEKGDPVPSNLSLAVLDDKLWTFADDKQDNILSWLLMSSELKGKIEDPDFYFKKRRTTGSSSAGYGYAYPWLSVFRLYGCRWKKKGELPFRPDQPYVMSGVIVNYRQKPVKASVFLVHH